MSGGGAGKKGTIRNTIGIIRKREEIEEEEDANKIFKRSALLLRSPIKITNTKTEEKQAEKVTQKEENMDDVLQQIAESIKKLSENYDGIKIEVEQGREEAEKGRK